MKSDSIQLIIDYREKRSNIEDCISKSLTTFLYDFKQLKVGDYIVENQFIVERKTTNDFLNSIKSGRLFEQAYKLRQSKLIPLIIIEGDRNIFANSNISNSALQGALLHLKLFVGIPVFFTDTLIQTLALFRQIYSQFAVNSQPRKVRRVNKKSFFKEKQKVLFLENLPGIGYKRALSLLENFKSIEKVLLASEEELSAISGIGKKTAKRIYEFVHSLSKQEVKDLDYNIDYRKQKFVIEDNVYEL